MSIKLVSWNVNGIRAVTKKDEFWDWFDNCDADIINFQEVRADKDKIPKKLVDIDGFDSFFNEAEKKGYSGTLVYTKQKPLNLFYGIYEKYNDEGRVLWLEFDDFYLVNAYVPNSQEELKRLDYRMVFEDDMRDYLLRLSQKKEVVYCGDLNVAHEEIDIKNPKSNERNAGFSIEERTKMTELLDSGFVDTFRHLNPEKIEYSWWSYRFQARIKNIGWRLDYFIVSKNLIDKVKDSSIKTDILGSDHAPIVLALDL